MNLNLILLLTLKLFRGYNKRLLINFIIYYSLFNIDITNYKKTIYLILITFLSIYSIILKKSLINKYDIFLNIIINKVFFRIESL